MPSFIDFLEKRSGHPLPGKVAQMEMAPQTNVRERLHIPPGARHNGVLILLHEISDRFAALYTLRSDSVNDHSGQICFPGGGSEPHETLELAAIRELREEVGISLDPGEVLLGLTPLYVPPSNNVIHPYIAYRRNLPDLVLQHSEVSEAFPLHLDNLADSKNLKVEDWQISNSTIKVPYWKIHRVPLWGATAMITNELVHLYKEFTGH